MRKRIHFNDNSGDEPHKSQQSKSNATKIEVTSTLSCHISYLKGFKFLKLLDCCFTRFLGPSVRPSVLADMELDMVADMEVPNRV